MLTHSMSPAGNDSMCTGCIVVAAAPDCSMVFLVLTLVHVALLLFCFTVCLRHMHLQLRAHNNKGMIDYTSQSSLNPGGSLTCQHPQPAPAWACHLSGPWQSLGVSAQPPTAPQNRTGHADSSRSDRTRHEDGSIVRRLQQCFIWTPPRKLLGRRAHVQKATHLYMH